MDSSSDGATTGMVREVMNSSTAAHKGNQTESSIGTRLSKTYGRGQSAEVRVPAGNLVSTFKWLQKGAGNQAVQRLFLNQALLRTGFNNNGSPPNGPASTAVQRALDGTAMQDRYGLSKPWTVVPDDLNDVFDGESPTILNWISTGNRLALLTKLRNYLTAGQDDYATRYAALKDFNAYFSARELMLGNRPGALITADAGQLLVDLNSVSPPRKAELLRLFGSRGQAAIISFWRANPNFDLLDATLAARASGSAVVLTHEELQALVPVKSAHPPGSRFGAMPWGRGEKPDVAENKRVHFAKHCLRQHDPAKDGTNPDVDEPWRWMQKLRYVVPKSYIESYCGSLGSTDTQMLVGDGDRISTQQQANYFFNVYLTGKDNLIQALHHDYESVYTDYVKVAAQHLTAPFVILNAGKIQVVGLSNGDEFLVGKWELGAFGISSCYINSAKINENTPYKVWELG
jgi:hypothetical protein